MGLLEGSHPRVTDFGGNSNLLLRVTVVRYSSGTEVEPGSDPSQQESQCQLPGRPASANGTSTIWCTISSNFVQFRNKL